MSDNDFLAALHEDDLANGNLRGAKRRELRAEWSGENQWTSEGYLARVHAHRCKCGNTEHQFLGVFHREKTPKGSIHETRLTGNWQVPLSQKWPIEISSSDVDACMVCITTRGFSLP